MKLSNSQVLLMVSVVFVVLWYLIIHHDLSSGVSKNNNFTAHSEYEQPVFDRNSQLLNSENTTIDTRLLLEEIRSSFDKDEKINLAIDNELQSYIYNVLQRFSREYSYGGGSAVIMDIESGEVLSLVSYQAETDIEPLSHKAITGLYAPGSAIKPFIALAALQEGIIDPEKEILSTGAIELANPFQPDKPFVYKDWKAHGYVDMRQALAVSSNIYFYTIGGGYGDQPGLGIERLRYYLTLFGFGAKTGIDLVEEATGELPGPEQKLSQYNDEWRVGDTYLVAIGQHGYQITPLQLARATAIIANNGTVVTPKLQQEPGVYISQKTLPINPKYFTVVREGMERAVVEGTAAALYIDGVSIAAKTGTAEVGNERKYIHSWVTGYFPLRDPRYVFTVMLEQGPRGEEVGASAAMREVLLWLRDTRPEYVI